MLLTAAAATTPFLPRDAADAIGVTSVFVGLMTGATLLIRKAPRLPANERAPWRLVGIGMVIVAAGIAVLVVVWTTTESTAAFGPADLFYFAGYMIGMTGLVLLPHTTASKLQRLRLLLDGLIGAVAIAALTWTFLFQRVADALAGAPAWERIVGSSYPLFDTVMLVVLMIVTVRRSSLRFDSRLTIFALGFLSQAIADVGFLLSGAGKSFSEATPLFPLHLLAVMLFIVTGVLVDRPVATHEYADRSTTPLWAMLVPYGTALAMVIVLLLRIRWAALSRSDMILFVATLLTGALVIVRQSVAIRENRHFVEAQRTDLVSSISHELRTPLTAMVGFLEILEEGAIVSETERSEITAIVNHQASYLARIVSDLVMLASGNTDMMELRIAVTNIDELIWSSVNSSSIDPSTVRVDVERGLTGYVDPDRMEQVLVNLLSNAVRYGGDRALVVARAKAGDLVLEVHDDGPGVPRKHELTIWERFERGPHRLNAAVPGSGIGLAVTQAIAKAHGGSTGYRTSEQLGGACFWVRLPGRVQGPRRGTSSRADLQAVPKSRTA